MKPIFFILICVLLLSCNKKSGDSAFNERYLIGGFVIQSGDTAGPAVQITYADSKISTLTSDTLRLTYTYDSTGNIADVYLSSPTYLDTLYNYSYYSSDGDTIRIGGRAFNVSAQDYDTLQQTLIFNGGQLVEKERYSRNADNASPVSFTHEYYSYNSDGNISIVEEETANSARAVAFTFTSWDNNINPLNGQAKENFFEILYPGLPQTSSVHNPTAYTSAGVSQQLVYDYNKYNYPLHFYLKSQPQTLFTIRYHL